MNSISFLFASVLFSIDNGFTEQEADNFLADHLTDHLERYLVVMYSLRVRLSEMKI
jgi:hypothetical protein